MIRLQNCKLRIDEENEEIFLTMAKNGDQDAIEQIIEFRLPYAFSSINNDQNNDFLDYEEKRQMARICIFEAIRCFKSEKKIAFRTFLYVVIKNKGKENIYTFYRSKRNNPIGKNLSLDSLLLSDEERNYYDLIPDTDAIDPYEHLETIETRNKIRRIIEFLSPLENRILGLVYFGCKLSDIPDMIGVTYKSVDNALVRIRNKFRKLLKKPREKKKFPAINANLKGNHFHEKKNKIEGLEIKRCSECPLSKIAIEKRSKREIYHCGLFHVVVSKKAYQGKIPDYCFKSENFNPAIIEYYEKTCKKIRRNYEKT